MTKLNNLEKENKINDIGICIIDFKMNEMSENTDNLRTIKYQLEKTILNNNSEIDRIKQKKAFQKIHNLWKLK